MIMNNSIIGGIFSLQNAWNAYSASAQKLASGKRINSSSDDPAGMVIMQQMRAQMP